MSARFNYAGLVLVGMLAACGTGSPEHPDLERWEARASNVTIIRDDWGIPHISAKTDADVVFGLMYAQAEDDFNRIETNYLNAMGRLAEAEGEGEIYRDLRMKLFIDPDSLRAKYAASPEWLRSLMDAFADGLNYYLHTHPEVKPRVIARFEPWMALSFSEGSIGGDIERVSLRELEAFYGGQPAQVAAAHRTIAPPDNEPRGSNGIAIAPKNSASGRSMLLINPHTSFFFRAEVHVTSEEGLNAYGAVTWGQFFVYQGFNDRAGWMHTSSGVDNIDEYLLTTTSTADGHTYRFGNEERPVTSRTIKVPYKTSTGMAERSFTVHRTHHGPVVRAQDGKWVAVRLMEEPVKALSQSYGRTKARNLQQFRQTMELHTNSSNNTVYADADGNIAYFHANFVPRRDTRFDWSRPVDGSNPATEWQGIHSIDESPNVFNPSIGWVYNTNNWPYSAAGPDSPRRDRFPAYMETYPENPRGINAIRQLTGRRNVTLDTLIAIAYNRSMPAFDDLIPALLSAADGTPASDPLKTRLAEQLDSLRRWDRQWGVASVPTSLAVFWGEELWQRVINATDRGNLSVYEYMAGRTSPAARLEALAAASDKLAADFGTWKTPWGEINRFQRITGDIVHPFDDASPSIPVGFTSGRWGSLAVFGARAYPGTKKWYGTSGNSFVAAVEFGDSVRARAITAGGQSGHPSSPHFGDQAERYSTGTLREVYFYPDQLVGRTKRTYRPGK
ncbi:MAG: acylase [Gemmatimonadales bacterium]|nr:acylase [Gemmatimonadales bacterium]